jgi:hypothetical protein
MGFRKEPWPLWQQEDSPGSGGKASKILEEDVLYDIALPPSLGFVTLLKT